MAGWVRAMMTLGAGCLGIAVWGLAGCGSAKKSVPPRQAPSAPSPVAAASSVASAPLPAAAAPASPAPAPVRPWDPKARAALEQALACTSAGRAFEAAEGELSASGWKNLSTSTPPPVVLPPGVAVFGLPVRAAAVSTAGGEHTFRSYLGDATPLQVIRAAALQRSRDGLSYGRAAKLGSLSMDSAKGEITLTCTASMRR